MVAVAAAALGYLFIYRHDLNNDRARRRSRCRPADRGQDAQLPKASLDDDFARAQTLVTDAYRPQLVAQRDAVRKGRSGRQRLLVDKQRGAQQHADHAAMLILLQARWGAADKARLITATVQVNFEKSAADQWRVANLAGAGQAEPGQG